MQLKRVSRSPIGVDIGTDSVKMIQVSSRAAKLGVIDMAVEKLQSGKGSPPNGEQILGAVKKIMQNGSFKGKEAVTILSPDLVDIRPLTINIAEGQEIGKIVRWEAESYLNYPGDEAVVDYIPLDSMEGKSATVLMVAARKADVLERMELLKKAGLRCRVIDIIPDALARVLGLFRGNKFPAGPVATMDVGARSSTIVLFRDGTPALSWKLNFSTDRLRDAVAERLELDSRKALELLKRFGVHPDDKDKPNPDELEILQQPGKVTRDISGVLFDIVLPFMGEMEEELTRFLNYCYSEMHGERIAKLLLFGGGSLMRNLDAYMKTRMEIDAEPGDPFMDIVLPDDEKGRPTKDLSATYSLALGLALRGVLQ